MKIVRYRTVSTISWGELENDIIYPLSNAPYNGGVRTGESLALSDVMLLAPCEPSKIVAVGKNYYEHVMEMGGDYKEIPMLFIKPTTCVNNPDSGIPYPKITKRLDYEGELAIVIGKNAKGIKADDAWDYILGYTILNDVTARDIQQSDGQWTRGKCMDLFAPIGPWIVTGLDASDLELTTRLNGEVKQHSRTSKFLWNIPRMLEFITAGMTLLPGDVVATGTPSGIGPMQVGDQVEIEIEGIGILRNHIVEG